MNDVDADRLVGRLVDVLSSAAVQLTKLEEYAKYWPDEGDRFLRLQDKVCAEAILLSYLASRVSLEDRRLYAAVELLRDRAEVHIATGRNEALLRRFPQTAATLGVGFVLLSRLGRSKPEIERLLRQALAQDFATLSERSVFRLMDTRWTYGLLEPGLLPAADDLLSLSTLGSSPHPLYTMNEDNYALTHAIYYLTDFGSAVPSAAFRQMGSYIVDPFLAWTAVRDDLDLLGEFLIAALAVREASSPAFAFAWHLFLAAWDDAPGLVGPEFSAARFAELAGEEAAAYAFLENYHTQFVGGILCAVALVAPRGTRGTPSTLRDGQTLKRSAAGSAPLARRCAEAATRADRRVRDGSRVAPSLPSRGDLPEWVCSRLLMVLDKPPDPAPRWLATAMTCRLSRDALVNVLYDALLIEAARSYRLVQLAEALAVGASHAALHTPTFTRALNFLLDQQLGDGFIGVNKLLAETSDEATVTDAQCAIAGMLAHIASVLMAAADVD